MLTDNVDEVGQLLTQLGGMARGFVATVGKRLIMRKSNLKPVRTFKTFSKPRVVFANRRFVSGRSSTRQPDEENDGAVETRPVDGQTTTADGQRLPGGFRR